MDYSRLIREGQLIMQISNDGIQSQSNFEAFPAEATLDLVSNLLQYKVALKVTFETKSKLRKN